MTFQSFYTVLEQKLTGIVPDIELKYKAEIAYEINRLKKEMNAVILGHNYMEPALYHSICDYTGDSLELSRIARDTNADIIVFCGVRFMAETAKILNPQKIVLVPSEQAGCSVAASITAADVRELKKRFPGVPVVTYVNTYADVKAESDGVLVTRREVEIVNALGLHARSMRYLESVAAGLQRHDLDGQPVAPVAPEHVHHAIMEVFRRRQSRTKEDLRPRVLPRLMAAIEASGMAPQEYAQKMRTQDEVWNAVLDEAAAQLAAKAARREALSRAFQASGLSMEAFAEMYGMDPAEVQRTLA